MVNKNKIKAVLFDWDDTVVGTFSRIADLIILFAKKEGLDIPDVQTISMNWSKPRKFLLASLWPHHDSDKLDSKFVEFVPRNFYLEPFPYSKKVIMDLISQGMILGVVSSSPKQAIDRTIKKYLNSNFGLFKIIQTAEDVAYHKPDPRVFDIPISKLEKLGISTNEIVYVGDGLHDYLAAKNKGLKFIAVTTGLVTKEQFMEVGLDERLIGTDLNNLISILYRLEKYSF